MLMNRIGQNTNRPRAKMHMVVTTMRSTHEKCLIVTMKVRKNSLPILASSLADNGNNMVMKKVYITVSIRNIQKRNTAMLPSML